MPDYFINPYTFVGLRDGKSKSTVSPQGDPLTGRITCRMITKTQLAIPDLSNDKTPEGINKHPFYRIGGKAAVPGSSIRGVIRNVYEALTNSCMHVNDKEDDYFSSRQNKEKPGVIVCENGGLVLYDADRIRIVLGLKPDDAVKIKSNKALHTTEVRKQLRQLEDFRIGDRVSIDGLVDGMTSTVAFKLKKDSSGKGIYMRADTLITGRDDKANVTHNNPAVFIPTTVKTAVTPEMLGLLRLNAANYVTDDKQVSRQYAACLKGLENGEKSLPVWYYERGGKIYLAPSQMSRSFFFNKPRDMLKKMGYTACSVKAEQCEACALFGMVGLGSKGEAAASRVRFGDAVCEDDGCFDNYYVLPILGGPRISSFEFYLKSKDDEYSFMDKKNFILPFDPDEKDTVIAGRKFYWHHKGKLITRDDPKSLEVARKAAQRNDPAERENFSSKDSCLELVKPKMSFNFDVYFDGITGEQLKKLLFSLNFGENDDNGTLCHKIGHGKPAGLGSVKIVADSVVIREFSDGNYSISEDQKEKYAAKAEELFNKAEYEQVLRAVDMDAIPDASLISYPKTVMSSDAFKWFAENRNGLTTAPGTIAFRRKLPHILAKDQRLPANIYKESEHQSSEQLQGPPEADASESWSSGIMVRRRGESNRPKPDKKNKKKKRR